MEATLLECVPARKMVTPGEIELLISVFCWCLCKCIEADNGWKLLLQAKFFVGHFSVLFPSIFFVVGVHHHCCGAKGDEAKRGGWAATHNVIVAEIIASKAVQNHIYIYTYIFQCQLQVQVYSSIKERERERVAFVLCFL